VPDARFATTRRKVLQVRGGKFCNHEEVAKSGVLGGFRELPLRRVVALK